MWKEISDRQNVAQTTLRTYAQAPERLAAHDDPMTRTFNNRMLAAKWSMSAVDHKRTET
jgi:hypothetical protein